MKVSDLLHFSKEKYYNGAVQTEWYYDKNRLKDVAESYVFHGPKYYGVSKTDLSQKNRPIDTATYTQIIADKLYRKSHGNNFLMTVAGYGTGKSHLSVCLGALFSGNNESKEAITSNLCKADKNIGSYVSSINTKKNLVIVLNGMNNFNLDAEVLRCARLSLAENGLDDSVLKKLTKSYDTAKHFVENAFDMLASEFQKEAVNANIRQSGAQLKQYLVRNIESDTKVLTLVNKVYKDLNGDSLHWDYGISAGEILSTLNEELCGEGKTFNKILILFDEFGRYIEYTAANPIIAGDASFQQIFEAVQNAQGNIIFVGLIQKELKTYTLCIDKASNFIRYIDRFKNSEEVYLSCNFETILANLIKKQDADAFNRIVKSAFEKYKVFHSKLYNAINRWDRNQIKKSVWSNRNMYNNIILEGCYPLHPLTVWFLSNSTNMLQQRSAIAFASEMFESKSNEVIAGAWLPYVYPVDIIDSGLYYDMLSSEESGNTQSQYCMLYRDILTKCRDKLTDAEIEVLKAILICNLSRFKFFNKDDAIQALYYCTNLDPEELDNALASLEEMHGVVGFDENNNLFDLIAEANGINEFKRVLNRYLIGTPKASIQECDEATLKSLNLDRPVETSFSQEHHIVSHEWSFQKELIDIADLNEGYLRGIIRQELSDLSGNVPRGTLIYAYTTNSATHIERVKKLCVKLELSKHPMIILLVEDNAEEIKKALRMKAAINRFSSGDYQRFERFINSMIKEKNKRITTTFTQAVAQRQMINSDGLVHYQVRINVLCTERFNKLYSSAPPFAFDGFANKTTTAAKKSLANICIKLFDRSLMNIQSYQALTQLEINRIKACLSVGVKTSWEVYDSSCNLVLPKNKIILDIYDRVFSQLNDSQPVSFMDVFQVFLGSPYGMNENSIALLFICFIVFKGNEILTYYNREKLSVSVLSKKIFKDNKLQMKELRAVSLQINANADKDIITELCNKILANTFVENCKRLKQQLEESLFEDGALAQNQLLLAKAQSINDDGIRLYKKIYDSLTNAEEIVKAGKQNFVIHKFAKVFLYLLPTDSYIEEGLPFVYSDSYKQKSEELRRTINKLLKNKFDAELKKLNCTIKQFGKLKSVYDKAANDFAKNGYKELAQKIRQRVDAIEKEIDAKQKYDTALVECNKDIALYSDASSFKYSQASIAKDKMERWHKFFEGAKDLPDTVKSAILRDIKKTIKECEQRLIELKALLSTAVTAYHQLNTLSSAKQALQLLQSMLKYELPAEKIGDIKLHIAEIQDAFAYLQNVPKSIDELRVLQNSLEIDSQNPIETLINNEVEAQLNELLSQQDKWKRQFLIPVENGINNLSAQNCVKWIKDTQTPPSYLDSTTLNQYRQLFLQIEKQLHKCRIDGVVSMYHELTEDEQRDFLKIILQGENNE